MKNILLVEDDPIVANLEKRIMSLAGLTVSHVDTFDKAAHALRMFPPDLILSDLQLAYGTMKDTLRFLTTISSKFPVVVSSGSLDITRISAACKAAGCLAYIGKTEFCRIGSERAAGVLKDAFNRFHQQGAAGATVEGLS